MSQGIIACGDCGVCDRCRVKNREEVVALAGFADYDICLTRYGEGGAICLEVREQLDDGTYKLRYSERFDNIQIVAQRLRAGR